MYKDLIDDQHARELFCPYLRMRCKADDCMAWRAVFIYSNNEGDLCDWKKRCRLEREANERDEVPYEWELQNWGACTLFVNDEEFEASYRDLTQY